MELGAALFALHSPDYRGAARAQNYLVPIPYVKYRSERFLIDDGIQGLLLNSKDLILSISGNGSVPVDDNPRRAGMDKLRASVEIGPSVEYRVLGHADSDTWLELPLRYAYLVDDGLPAAGWIVNPKIAWRKPAHQLGDWKLRATLGWLYADETQHDVYYQVDPGETLTDRPAYDAQGGDSGWRAQFTFSKRYGPYWLGGFVRHDNLAGSTIADSPMVDDESSWMAGISFGYVFADIY